MKQYIRITQFDGTTTEFSLFDGVSISMDKSNTVQTMNFNMPDGTTYSSIMSQDLLLEYFFSLDNVTYINLFTGYIDSLTPRLSKTTKQLDVTVLDKLSVMNRVTLQYNISMSSVLQFIESVMGLANSNLSTSWGTTFTYSLNGITDKIVAKDITPTGNVLEAFQELKDNIPIYINYISQTNNIEFTVPSFLQFNKTIQVYDFDIKTNVLGTLDYGNIASDINAVVYIGTGGVLGQAVDFISLVNTGKKKVIYRYDYSTGNKEKLEEMARQELLDRQRNHKIGFTIPITNTTLKMKLGEQFTIKDYNRFTGREIFIIDSIDYTIGKNDVVMNITGYAHTLTEFPEKIVLQKFGVADEDTLQVNAKVNGQIQ